MTARSILLRPFLLLALATLPACLPQVGDPVDAGGGATGGGAGGGGGASDSGVPPSCSDGLRNAAESDVDCGGACAACALGKLCGTALDCASGVCSTGLCAAPASVCPAAFASCTAFTDATAAAANRTIAFPVGGNDYSPKCLRIALGQTVTFSGSFSAHPLSPVCGPLPLITHLQSGSTAAVTFTALGVFGYTCDQHGSTTGSGMAGAIEVVR